MPVGVRDGKLPNITEKIGCHHAGDGAKVARVSGKNRQTGVRINTAEARGRLPMSTNNEPYWVAITPGTALGYYKGARDTCWYVRQRVGSKYVKQRIGTADDHVKADGAVVLSHAQAVALAVSTQLAERQPAPRHYADGQTLNSVIAYYIEHQLAGKGSEAMTKLWVARHITDSIGAKLVTALDADALRRWHRQLASKPPAKRKLVQPENCPKKRYSEADPAKAFDPTDPTQVRARKSTANRILTIVKAALNFAWRNDKLPADLPSYWAKVEPFALGEDPPPRMLEQSEITRLLNAAPPALRELLTGALMTGARYGELCGLQVRDYSSEHATVRIYQSKTGKTLQQPLTHEGEAFFDRLTAGRRATDAVFTKADGTPWGRGDATRPTREAAEAAGLEDVSFKTTRATYGKLLLVATRDIEMVARALGHSDSRITRRHYAQYLPNEVAGAVAKMPSLGIAVGGKVSRIGKKRRAG